MAVDKLQVETSEVHSEVVVEDDGKVIAIEDERVDLVTVPEVGPQGPQGQKGEKGELGPVGEAFTWTHVQSVPADTWILNHNLDRFPTVDIVDSAGTKVLGAIKYISSNVIELNFAVAFSGKAYLN